MIFPRLKDGVILRKRNCKFKQDIDVLVRSSYNTGTFSLDSKLFDFLTYCNGVNNFNNIKNIYYKIFKEKPLTIKKIINDNYLNKILECSKIKSSINKNQIVQVDRLKCSCRNAIFHLTNLCNLNCRHCYYTDKKTQKNNFTKEEIKIIIENLHQLGVEKVTITGGEPLLVKEELKYLTSLLSEKCLFFTINTNAFEKLNLLLKIFKNNPYADSVQISLDGDRKIHEKLRGKKGCYPLIYKHIKQLTKEGIKIKVVSMITKDWRKKERDIFQIIHDLRVKQWLIEIPTKAGRWKNNYQRYGINKDQLVELCKKLVSLIKNKNHCLESFTINQIYHWPECQSFIKKKLSDPICFHDLGLLSFGPEGISFCSLFGEKFGTSLYKIALAHTRDIKKTWNFIARTRINHKIGDNQCCQKCNFFEHCQGGCPGQYSNPVKFKGCDTQSKFLASVKKEIFK